MAKKDDTIELTLEERLAISEARANKAEADNKSQAEQLALLEQRAAESEVKAEDLAMVNASNPNAELITLGSFKSVKTKKKYGFKIGNIKVRKKDGSIISSEEALKDVETMEWLVKIGSAILEEK